MTDVLTGKEVLQKAIAYVESVARESRKALTSEFGQKYRGVEFDSVPQILRQSVLDWFSHRDKSLKLAHDTTSQGRLGEVRMTFRGETKEVHFKVHLHAMFTLSGQSANSPCFLKEVNVFVDPREFSR